MPIDYQTALDPKDILKEINRISADLDSRLAGLSELDALDQKTLQLLAVGALFFGMVHAEPPEHREHYMQLAWKLGHSMQGHPGK